MKKILSVVLMAAMVLSVAGCNQYDYITNDEIQEWQNTNNDYSGNIDYSQPVYEEEFSTNESTVKEETDNKISSEKLEYSENNLFKYGRACVNTIDGMYGYIDETGTVVIEDKYFRAYDFSRNGLAAVKEKENGKEMVGYIDLNGNYVIGPTSEWDSIGSFSDNGLAWVKDGESGLLGYIDDTGEFVLDFQYSYAQDFGCDELAMVTLDGKNIVIDETGTCIFEMPEYTTISASHDFSDNGLIPACYNKTNNYKQDKYGFIDKNGNWVIEPQYRYVSSFANNGRAVIKTMVMNDENTTWIEVYGVIDEKGNVIVEPQFNLIYAYNDNGLAAAENQDDLWGFIDSSGEWAIEPIYKKAYGFAKNGLAVVDGSRYIDENGSVIIETGFDSPVSGFYDDGYAMIDYSDGTYHIFDESCNLICDDKFE